MAGVGGRTHFSGGHRAGESPWDDRTKDEQLRQLWRTKPVADIAREMRMTKNQIAGRAHRLKLEPYVNPVKRDPALGRSPAPLHGKAELDAAQARMAYATRPIVVRPKPLPKPAPFVYAPVRECCWPIGEPRTKEFRYCDEPTVPGKPYCEPHCTRAWGPKQEPVAEDADARV